MRGGKCAEVARVVGGETGIGGTTGISELCSLPGKDPAVDSAGAIDSKLLSSASSSSSLLLLLLGSVSMSVSENIRSSGRIRDIFYNLDRIDRILSRLSGRFIYVEGRGGEGRGRANECNVLPSFCMECAASLAKATTVRQIS